MLNVMQQNLFNRDVGIALRDQVLESLEVFRAELVQESREYAIRHAKTFGTVTSDDVRVMLDCKYGLISGVDMRFLGSVMCCKELKPLEKDGMPVFVATKNKKAHARPIRVFALA